MEINVQIAKENPGIPSLYFQTKRDGGVGFYIKESINTPPLTSQQL